MNKNIMVPREWLMVLLNAFNHTLNLEIDLNEDFIHSFRSIDGFEVNDRRCNDPDCSICEGLRLVAEGYELLSKQHNFPLDVRESQVVLPGWEVLQNSISATAERRV